MAIILFGFQTAIGNVQTLPSDLFSGKTVGSLAGFAGMAAKLAAAGLTYLVPWLTTGGNYTVYNWCYTCNYCDEYVFNTMSLLIL